MKNKVSKFTIGIIGGVIVLVLGFFVWMNNSYNPTEEAVNALISDDKVSVTEDNLIIFEPTKETKKGFIFYPGGKVEPEAYSVLARKIAEEGYLTVIVPMTFDLAIISPNKADKVIERFPEIESWGIGGHSLGGVMAAGYAAENDVIDGLVLYASYPQGEELKDLDINVLSIYGSNDGVADLEKVKNATLTKDSEIVEIEGGNHAGFGNYGEQKGDKEATISAEDQIEKSVEYTVEFLEKIN